MRRGAVIRRLVVLLMIGVLVVLGAVVAVRVVGANSSARRAAESYNKTLPRDAETVSTRSTVTLIGDDLSSAPQLGTPTRGWFYTAGAALDDRIISLSSAGSGYTARASNTSFGGTFVARAQGVDPTSQAIVLFGGANDVRASRTALRLAVQRSITAARSVAPRAAIVVVGPAWPSDTPPAEIIRVRDTVRSAAQSARTTWVDPLAQHWLTAKGRVRSDQSTPSQAGQDELAERLEPVLRAAVE